MPSYVVGQRFVSEAEPELGLGCVEVVGKELRRLVALAEVNDPVRPEP